MLLPQQAQCVPFASLGAEKQAGLRKVERLVGHHVSGSIPIGVGPHTFLLRLLFDEELRTRFGSDRAGVLRDYPDAAPLADVDQAGLVLDAALRGRYLMSSLCRAYPLSCGALGADGGEALRAFLASPQLLKPLARRNAAFGDHLKRLVDFGDHGWLEPVLAWERALVDNAAAVRADPVTSEGKPSSGQRKRGHLALPSHTVVAQLPWSLELLTTALEGLSAANAWHRIEAGRVDVGRLDSVARGRPLPVTMVGRGLAGGPGLQRVGGDVAPLIEVRHITAELVGTQAARLQRLAGQKLDALNDPDRRFASRLLDAELLTLIR